LSDWKRAFDKWKTNYNYNKDTDDPKLRLKIDSPFILKEGDQGYKETMARNELQGSDVKDEAKYLFKSPTNCPNLAAKAAMFQDNNSDAQYSQLAKMFDDEVQKIKEKKHLCVKPRDCLPGSPLKLKNSEGKTVKYYFSGMNYNYKNLEALAKICIYDDMANTGLDDSTNPNACSPGLIKASAILAKYHTYGLASLRYTRLTNSLLFTEIFVSAFYCF
jgi:hypothetical protein